MKILSYKFSEPNSWCFERIDFNSINLLVGRNGSGKTRLLNTIVNFFKMFRPNSNEIQNGEWEVKFKISSNDNNEYTYIFKAESDQILEETLLINSKIHINRKNNSIIIDGKEMPGFGKNIIGLKAFSQTDILVPILKAFQNVYVRRYNPYSYLEQPGHPLVSLDQLTKIIESDDSFINYLSLTDSILPELGFFYLKEKKREELSKLKKDFCSYFDYVEDLDLLNIDKIRSQFPIINESLSLFCLCIKENNSWIPTFAISSGMKKYLEALIDLYATPSNCIIIYDEFENGLDPINITDLIDLFLEKRNERQYIFTSHHPNIINNFPVKNWIVLNRDKYSVHNLSGDKIEKDTQIKGAFISLLNSKFYSGE